MAEYVAVVCKRGHIAMRSVGVGQLDPAGAIEEVGSYCERDGSPLFWFCENCHRPLSVIALGAEAPGFCPECGLPYPWANREQIVYHVQNLLDQEDLDAGIREALHEELNELLTAPKEAGVEDRQLRVMQKLREKAPAAWNLVSPILMPLLSAELRTKLGLPPA